jgi:Raf kinase inhibitor-like YbhB/YbcL family protein
MYDPDAPTGSGWWHWVIFNIPTTTNSIPEGAGDKPVVLPGTKAVQSMTDFGKPGYGGPCPPVGDTPHHYTVTIYALKVDSLPLTYRSSGAMVGYYINQNSLGSVSLTGLYGR